MPRDGSGVYSAPAGTTASPNTTIESSKYNALVSDLVTDANAARPITAGGTGETTASAARMALGAAAELQPQASIASAATTDIGSIASENVLITGTNNITNLGTAPAGTHKRLRFEGALTLTHNATSQYLQGQADILTAADDEADAYSSGSGNWKVMDYTRAAFLSEPKSKSAAGIGQFLLFAGAAGAQWQLPATGTYEYFGFRIDSAGAVLSAIGAVAAGGTIVGAGVGSDVWRGFYKRIS